VQDTHEAADFYANRSLAELLLGSFDEPLHVGILHRDRLGWAVGVALGDEADHPGDALEAQEGLEVRAADEDVRAGVKLEHVEVALGYRDENLDGVVAEDAGKGVADPAHGRFYGLLRPQLAQKPVQALDFFARAVLEDHASKYLNLVKNI